MEWWYIPVWFLFLAISGYIYGMLQALSISAMLKKRGFYWDGKEWIAPKTPHCNTGCRTSKCVKAQQSKKESE